MGTLLSLGNVSRTFGGLQAITGVSFEIRAGEILGIIGPNGSGKSTLFNMITGFYPSTSGNVMFKGREITHIPTHEIVRIGIARTFQATTVFSALTVAENLLTAYRCRIRSGVFDALMRTRQLRIDEQSARKKVSEVLQRMDLLGREEQRAGELSGAEQKRLSIALALMTGPELLLLDEPTGGLSIPELEEVISSIRRLRDSGITIAIIEHKMRLLMNVSDRVVALNKGVKIAEGTPAQISTNSEVVKSYLGERYVTQGR